MRVRPSFNPMVTYFYYILYRTVAGTRYSVYSPSDYHVLNAEQIAGRDQLTVFLMWFLEGVLGGFESVKAREAIRGGCESERIPNCSSCHESSCPMKLKFGEMTRRFD